jgi:hypothetical protein
MKDKLTDKFVRFEMLVGAVAFVIALVAAYFSIYGIATLFAGAFISTAIMATVLEIGKLISVSYLYRYWKETKAWLATYLILALIVLMVITSGGIFGYLSSAYQKSATEYRGQKDQITIIEKNKTYAQNRIDQAQIRIEMLNQMRKTQEGRLSEALTNNFISRNPIALKQLQDQTAEMIEATENNIKIEQSKIDAGVKDIQEVDQQVSKLRFSNNNKDIRTFEFVATLFGTTLDNVAKWFIFLLITVFDPLAIALVLAYNVMIYKKQSTPITPEIVESLPEAKNLSITSQFAFPMQRVPKPLTVESHPKPSEKVESKKMEPIHPNPNDLIAKGNSRQV